MVSLDVPAKADEVPGEGYVLHVGRYGLQARVGEPPPDVRPRIREGVRRQTARPVESLWCRSEESVLGIPVRSKRLGPLEDGLAHAPGDAPRALAEEAIHPPRLLRLPRLDVPGEPEDREQGLFGPTATASFRSAGRIGGRLPPGPLAISVVIETARRPVY